MVTKVDLQSRVAELELELRERDTRIKELQDDLDRARKVADRKHSPISGNVLSNVSSPKPKLPPGNIDS